MSEHKAQERELLDAMAKQKQRPTCISCKSCITNAAMMGQGQGECWYLPPTVFPVQGPKGEQGRMAIYPPVNLTTQWCHFHEEDKILIAKSLPPDLRVVR